MDEQGTYHSPLLYTTSSYPLAPLSSSPPPLLSQTNPNKDRTHLIQTLSTHDTSTTNLYTSLLTLLPLVLILPHFLLLPYASTFLWSLAAIASFLASAYALYFLPLPPVKVNITTLGDGKSTAGKTETSTSTQTHTHTRPTPPYISTEAADLLAKYIIPFNALLSGVLILLEAARGRTWNEGLGVGGGYLPALVFGIIIVARREVRGVDLSELERLREGMKDM